MTTYYYLVASEKFLTSDNENLHEVLEEKERDYKEKNKEKDFWFIKQPAFLDAPEFKEIKAKCPQPAAAILSLNEQWITFLKLRLEYVITGKFDAPSADIPEPLASLTTV
ncbi:MgPME-cyclase complex family protein [Cyanobacterium aponinum UTEX 3222]|uniref:DUF2488 family protein n=3 Tax=Cyanobacterium aponinum TaxID=379064 RepID=K9Z670_CYAAP|nr:MgPME-cyclase complex family protein [Cyanobacterium aponinum]WRL43820.1 MgPME-cyclase complex family protein [Cyanobacterium aponinum UTEX 3222]AFZ54222.1 Protein of unknown function DUF2488 [Cyanobacterium aponinum PCC 10605]MBD2393829.1 DUF2488 family protein [Cyanobacterium aponinum FACHB-4101]MTF40353.1 DUF2488 family protein [Cyanobacterium aponinum 0216]PHV64252.1 DUF2488 domain-containing protein [Cyanobacterium aponinum IPPAS B-1201]